MRRAALRASLALLLLAAPAAAAPDFEAFQAQPYAPPKPAPAFSLPGLDGRITALSDLCGRVALLFFWATW